MLVLPENIPEYIPQRYPMIMTGCLLSCEGSQAVSQLTVSRDNIFTSGNGMSPAGMMEAMAQTVALRTGYLLKKQPGGPNKKIPVGVIGSIKNFRLHFLPPPGSVMTTTIIVLHEVLQASVVSGKTEVDGRIAAESELQIFLTEEQAAES